MQASEVPQIEPTVVYKCFGIISSRYRKPILTRMLQKAPMMNMLANMTSKL